MSDVAQSAMGGFALLGFDAPAGDWFFAAAQWDLDTHASLQFVTHLVGNAVVVRAMRSFAENNRRKGNVVLSGQFPRWWCGLE